MGEIKSFYPLRYLHMIDYAKAPILISETGMKDTFVHYLLEKES